jgi:UDP-N-acetylmuramate dehydrogenase
MSLEVLTEKLGSDRLKQNEQLSVHVYMKVGGPADLYYEAKNSKELEEVIKLSIREEIPFTLLGNGSNVLVSDKGVRGLVIKNNAEEIKLLPFGFVEVDSGVELSKLISLARNNGLTGLERLIRVPGTVGGAIFMNAGDTFKKKFIGDLVVWVEVVDKEGNIKKLELAECEFGYRSSRFQKSGETILRVKLQLKQETKEKIEIAARDILVRKMKQPTGSSMGSTFKNPPETSAGELIEKAGLKGKQIGGAKISEVHGNFIINTGNATAKDVKDLIDLIKRTVKEKFGIDLQEEIRYIGEW